MTYDAVVVGGSVAGASTARELARRGLSVALVEKARFPRPKACGEGLMPHGVAALEAAGLAPRGASFRGLRWVSPSGRVAEADFPDDARGLVVKRERFDAWLFEEAALTPGVTAFRETVYERDRFPARWIVAADGLHSAFHDGVRVLAFTPPRVGLSTHVRGLQGVEDRVEVILHAGGELYLAPLGDGEALAACLFWADRLPPGSNEQRVRAVIESLPFLSGRRGRITFSSPVLGAGPLGLAVRPLRSGNVLFVGDAAGAPDPVTGEGMSLAVLSARALAEALAAEDVDSYEARRRELAAGSDWLSRWMRRGLRHPAAAEAVVASLARCPSLFSPLLEIAVGKRRPPASRNLREALA